MQIHELTRSRKVAEGFGSALGNQLLSKAFGGTDVRSKYSDPQSREQGFQSQVNSPAARTLATTMQAAWAQTVQNFLANSKDAQGNPATNLKTVSNPSMASLQPELQTLVNKMIGGAQGANFDYTRMANGISDPVVKQGITEVISRITEYIKQLFDATIAGTDPKQLSQLWVKLVGDGILPAQNAMAYDRKSMGAAGKPKFGQDQAGNMMVSINGGSFERFLPQSNLDHKAIADKMAAGQL